jgi:three-Cys-motif partner protein
MSKNTVGPWAKDKLDRLGKYLAAYTKIMRKREWCEGFHYFDAFAGPGQHEVRKKKGIPAVQAALLEMANFGQEQEEQIAFLKGSPRVALELEHPFSSYVFIDMDPDRVRSLESLKKEYVNRRIVIRSGDCNRYLLEKVAQNPGVNWRKHRAVVFLDPFGMQVEWSTIEALASTKAIEVFLNFPVGMAIQRLLHRNPADFDQRQREKLDRYFGSPDWYGAIYRPTTTLFGDKDQKICKSGEALVRWYRDRLKGAFGHASRAALIRNTTGGHLYYLLLASPNATGVKIANNILSAGEYV